MKTCPYCDGSGIDGLDGGQCQYCDGTGEMHDGSQYVDNEYDNNAFDQFIKEENDFYEKFELEAFRDCMNGTSLKTEDCMSCPFFENGCER